MALAFTPYAVLRRSPWVGMCAGGAAALLVTDAWFDVVTAPGGRAGCRRWRWPSWSSCRWRCRHAKELADRRIGILLGSRPDAG